MNRDELADLIVTATQEIIYAEDGEAGVIAEDTYLFGENGLLDSISLVSLILDVELQVNESLETTIAIADGRAMSQKHSPFRTIGRLTDFIMSLLEDRGQRAEDERTTAASA